MVHKKEMTFKWKGAPTDGVAESNGRSYRFSAAIYSDSGRTDHLTSVRIWSGLAAVVTMDSDFFFLLPLLPTLEISFSPAERGKVQTDATRVRVQRSEHKRTAAANARGIVMSAL